MRPTSPIPQQVELPLRVALEVVLRGIRIRLGRSLVTITGVVCGIAFLMSILTGQWIQRGVRDEDALRGEVDRMLNFLRADLPGMEGKTVLVHVSGSLREEEMRVLESLEEQGVAAFGIAPAGHNPLPRKLARAGLSAAEALAGAQVVLLMGDGPPPGAEWLEGLGDRPLASSLAADLPPLPRGQTPTRLARTPDGEDIQRLADHARQERFRSVWIGAISLLVTVIGIANAMLMSVTERFREIGTMKCLGSLSSFIRRIFLLESSLMGLVGGLVGSLAGALFSLLAYSLTYGPGLVLASVDALPLLLSGLGCVGMGVLLSVAAALYPAGVASRMVPAHALRSNV